VNPIFILTLLVLLLICAWAAVRVADLISAVLVLGGYSFFLALAWAAMGSVDVAFTEAVVGAGASTVFFLLALFRTSSKTLKPERIRARALGTAVVIALGALLLYGALDLPRWGDPASTTSTHVSNEYLLRSIKDTDTPNVVTSVLADYRGFDTLIETTVIFTAGIACLMIMGLKQRKP
jgi:multicomponent Na+:H+ antiporter subunit B